MRKKKKKKLMGVGVKYKQLKEKALKLLPCSLLFLE